MLIFVSLIATCFFTLMALLALNYAVFLWENKRVNDLTSQIKHTADGILQKSNVTRNFTSVDLGGTVTKSKAIQVATNIYDRAMVTFKKQEYPTWLTRFFEELNLFRKNAWKSLIRFLKYLISLTRPAIKDDLESLKGVEDQKRKQAEVEELVDRVNSIDSEIESNELDIYDEKKIEENKPIDVLPVRPQEDIDADQVESKIATIGFAAGDDKSEKDMNIFEKLESRILEKLKTEGFDQYDIWLELGNLYQKYGENEKAVEIYALVLKHSEGSEKMIARDKLIGLT